jgi:hypothetical protein
MSRNEDATTSQFPELTPFETALAALAPRAAEFDRESFFFQAGQAATLRDQDNPWTRWAWPGAFSAMTAVAAMLLAMLCLRTEPTANRPAGGTMPEVAAAQAAPGVVPDPESKPEDRGAGIATFFRLREAILRRGMDAFPAEKVASTEASAAAPLTYHELLDQILHE